MNLSNFKDQVTFGDLALILDGLILLAKESPKADMSGEQALIAIAGDILKELEDDNQPVYFRNDTYSGANAAYELKAVEWEAQEDGPDLAILTA